MRTALVTRNELERFGKLLLAVANRLCQSYMILYSNHVQHADELSDSTLSLAALPSPALLLPILDKQGCSLPPFQKLPAVSCLFLRSVTS